MKNYRTLTMIGGWVLMAAIGLAQTPPPAAPAPPAPPAIQEAPTPPTPPLVRPARVLTAPKAPMAPMAPMAPVAMPAPMALPDAQTLRDLVDNSVSASVGNALGEQFQQSWGEAQERAMEAQQRAMEKAQEAQQRAMERADAAQQNAMERAAEAQAAAAERMAEAQEKLNGVNWGDLQDKLAMANSKLADMKYNFNFNFPKNAPLAQQRIIYGGRGSDENLYNNGIGYINNHQYDQAVSEFNLLIARNGSRTESALYWKAYSLNKLGRTADAQAAIDQLRKSYPNSRWLDDAKALELEVKQSKGPVSPESETDEDIKILALNGLMQSDPEKALPQIENILKGAHSPKLKRQAVVVIGMNNTPRARQDLEQIAKSGNPDLQLAAIRYLQGRRDANNSQLFWDIYAGSDNNVKSTLLSAFAAARDKDHLLQILKTEKDDGLRTQTIRDLGEFDGQPELWQAYPSESTAEGKIALLNAMQQNGNLDKLVDVARTDKDSKVREKAVRVIASQEPASPTPALVSLYAKEQDEQVKRAIIDAVYSKKDGKAMVDLAKAEKEYKLKLRIVDRLSNMTKYSKEASDYLQELLSR
ncbi:MAG TPA: hypothetical protein VLY04_11650 [Bryobacteraceae bacterium]|nr:hypothetical protein [Bryobacteraceae bacterium]